jgi:Fic family protein
MYKIFKQIQELSQKISHDSFEAIMKRQELSWPTHPTYIEWNTLTREETALTTEEGFTSDFKPIEDCPEAKNHTEVFDYTVSLVNQEKVNYEDLILRIHSLILTQIHRSNLGA